MVLQCRTLHFSKICNQPGDWPAYFCRGGDTTRTDTQFRKLPTVMYCAKISKNASSKVFVECKIIRRDFRF